MEVKGTRQLTYGHCHYDNMPLLRWTKAAHMRAEGDRANILIFLMMRAQLLCLLTQANYIAPYRDTYM